MTAVTAPGGRRSLLALLLSAVLPLLKPRQGSRKVAEVVAVARKHVMTFAALSAMDLGAFQVWHHGGWFVLGVSLLLLHFAVEG